jgi:hypothetical protein
VECKCCMDRQTKGSVQCRVGVCMLFSLTSLYAMSSVHKEVAFHAFSVYSFAIFNMLTLVLVITAD